jgi:hypothetical protein
MRGNECNNVIRMNGEVNALRDEPSALKAINKSDFSQRFFPFSRGFKS